MFFTPSHLRKEPQASERRKFSIATIVLDGTSHMNMLRRLPLTQATMEKLGGVALRGHHKVGMGSYDNIRELYAGQAGDYGWGVANKYIDQGWTSMILEEAPTIVLDGGNFSVNFEMAYQFLWSKFPNWNMKCLMETLSHKPMFAVIEDFLEINSNTHTLLHAHFDGYTHDDLNIAPLYDADLSSMVTRLRSSGALNDTFLVILGDHGFWLWSTFYWTPQGRVENNMPMTMVLPPPGFAEEHPEMIESLNGNADKLTSHKDTSKMMRHLLAMSTGQEEETLFPGTAEEPGESLLRDVGERGCKEAGIPLPHCSCNREELVPESVKEAVQAALKDMDVALNNTALCQPLALDRVVEASKIVYEGLVWIQAAVVVVPKKVEFLVEISLPPAAKDMTEATAEVKRTGGTSSSECVKGQTNYSKIQAYCICK